jgi:hypothetical protein
MERMVLWLAMLAVAGGLSACGNNQITVGSTSTPTAPPMPVATALFSLDSADSANPFLRIGSWTRGVRYRCRAY